MDINIERIGVTLVVKPEGEIDHHYAAKLKDKIDREIYENKVNNLILDFDNVTFMDSSGIGVIVGRYKIISSLGGKVMIVRANKQINKILEISGLKNLLSETNGGK